MGMCLDTEDCRFQNRDKARFCAKCGIPTQGALLQGRYEIQYLISKDHSTVTLRAIDRHEGLPVIVRALIPNKCSEETRWQYPCHRLRTRWADSVSGEV